MTTHKCVKIQKQNLTTDMLSVKKATTTTRTTKVKHVKSV